MPVALVHLPTPLAALAWEGVLEPLLILSGVALLFLSLLGAERLRRAGSGSISVRQLFSLQGNLVGLFALIGLVLIALPLVLRGLDFRGRLEDTEARLALVEARLGWEQERTRSIIEQHRSMNIRFKLDFPQGAEPEDLEGVEVDALVRREGLLAHPEPWPVAVQPEPGGLTATVFELKPGDSVRLHASQGEQLWRSEFFRVPSVTLQMEQTRSAPLAEGRP